MNPQQRKVVFGLCAALGVSLLSWSLWPSKPPAGKLTVASLDVPIVMHTSGGRLEVATVTATEAFKFDAPPKSLLGVDLGKTVSHIQAKVIYRYYIDMAKEWPVQFQGNAAVVQAGEIKPTLPIAFDTSTMEKETRSGWARFDKHENMAELERRMTPELERRAHGYKSLALPSARLSVSDFARTWLSKQQHWQSLKIAEVKVVFPGDPPITGTTNRPPQGDQ